MMASHQVGLFLRTTSDNFGIVACAASVFKSILQCTTPKETVGPGGRAQERGGMISTWRDDFVFCGRVEGARAS